MNGALFEDSIGVTWGHNMRLIFACAHYAPSDSYFLELIKHVFTDLPEEYPDPSFIWTLCVGDFFTSRTRDCTLTGRKIRCSELAGGTFSTAISRTGGRMWTQSSGEAMTLMKTAGLLWGVPESMILRYGMLVSTSESKLENILLTSVRRRKGIRKVLPSRHQ